MSGPAIALTTASAAAVALWFWQQSLVDVTPNAYPRSWRYL